MEITLKNYKDILEKLNTYANQNNWFEYLIDTNVRLFSVWDTSEPFIITFSRELSTKYEEELNKRKNKGNSNLINAIADVDVYSKLDTFILEHIRVNFPYLTGNTIRFWDSKVNTKNDYVI